MAGKNREIVRGSNYFLRRTAGSVLLVSLLSGCFFSSREKDLYSEGLQLLKNNQYAAAFQKFDQVVRRAEGEEIAVKAAQMAADISLYQSKDLAQAVEFCKYIVLHASKARDRVDAKKRLAQIYFEHLNNYPQAIVEFNRLLFITEDKEEKASYKVAIAKSYYYQNNFYQAEIEIEDLLSKNLSEQQKYDVLLLKGNIKLAQKKVDEAITIFTDLLNEYPERAAKDNVSLHLAVCYEEKKDFARAIEVLDEIREDYDAPDFINERIKNLKRRQSFLPGARGLRK